MRGWVRADRGASLLFRRPYLLVFNGASVRLVLPSFESRFGPFTLSRGRSESQREGGLRAFKRGRIKQ